MPKREQIKASDGHEEEFRATYELKPEYRGRPFYEMGYEHAATHKLYPDELNAIAPALQRKDDA